MNRSIFLILKTNFKNILINFIFIYFLYLFNFYYLNLLSCEDKLAKAVVNGVNVRYSPSISYSRLYNSINFLQHHILNTPVIEHKFSIFRYLQPTGLRFSHTHVYDHYHINLYLDNMYNVHYGFSLTHNPQKLNLSPKEFEKFSLLDLYGNNRIQYVLNDLKVYDLSFLKVDDNSFKFKQFLLQHNENCILHFKHIVDNV